ncbi:MAG: nucleoside diphosphate kinase regulator [Gammaproteobacteria bacterium]|nr:nucleoside diphosphate kinase regulator [Gammaproteobacteria bacterium]
MNTGPHVMVSTRDAARLESMLEKLSAKAFPGKAKLEEELARAQWVAPEAMPPNRVTMNSTVRFRVESSAESFTLKLVYPKDAGDTATTVSILAPVGSALLGLAEGDQISWPKPGGGFLAVRIEEVMDQPERAGDHTA